MNNKNILIRNIESDLWPCFCNQNKQTLNESESALVGSSLLFNSMHL